jgi:hypothetical protein
MMSLPKNKRQDLCEGLSSTCNVQISKQGGVVCICERFVFKVAAWKKSFFEKNPDFMDERFDTIEKLLDNELVPDCAYEFRDKLPTRLRKIVSTKLLEEHLRGEQPIYEILKMKRFGRSLDQVQLADSHIQQVRCLILRVVRSGLFFPDAHLGNFALRDNEVRIIDINGIGPKKDDLMQKALKLPLTAAGAVDFDLDLFENSSKLDSFWSSYLFFLASVYAHTAKHGGITNAVVENLRIDFFSRLKPHLQLPLPQPSPRLCVVQ